MCGIDFRTERRRVTVEKTAAHTGTIGGLGLLDKQGLIV